MHYINNICLWYFDEEIKFRRFNDRILHKTRFNISDFQFQPKRLKLVETILFYADKLFFFYYFQFGNHYCC